jgi:hypothetical protein
MTHTFIVAIAEAIAWPLTGKTLRQELADRAEAGAVAAGVLEPETHGTVYVGRTDENFVVTVEHA